MSAVEEEYYDAIAAEIRGVACDCRACRRSPEWCGIILDPTCRKQKALPAAAARFKHLKDLAFPKPTAPPPGGSPPTPQWLPPPIDDTWLSSIL
jgi:hypothetical protein